MIHLGGGFWQRFDDRLGLDANTDYLTAIRLRCFIVFSVTLGVLLLAYATYRAVAITPFDATEAVTIAAGLFALSAPWTVWLTRSLNVPALSLVAFAFIGINLAGYFNGGLASPGIAYVVLTVAFSAIFWGVAGGVITFMLAASTLFGQYALMESGILPPPSSGPETRPILNAIILLLISVTLTLLIVMLRSIFTRVAHQLDGSRRQSRLVLDHMDQGFALYDSAHYLLIWSRRFTELLHIDPSDLRRRTGRQGAIRIDATDAPDPKGAGLDETVYKELLADTGRLHRQSQTFERAGPGGTVLEVYGKHLPDGGLLTTYTDVTEEAKQRRRIEELALKDSLTGLSNRLHFQLRLEDAIKYAERHDKRIALCVLDLDRFKQINDLHGHLVGDEVLKTVARRMMESVRGVDTVARFGGDEFAIILTELSAYETVVAPMRRIIDTIREPIELDGDTFNVATSIGISYYPKDGDDPNILFRNADMALFEAKESAPGTIRSFDHVIDEKVRRRARIDAELRHALANDELVFHFQPQIDLRTGEVCGVEALLRWQHPQRGLVTPAEFLDVVESGDIVRGLGQWTVREAMACTKRWRAEGLSFGRLGVNISPRHFRARSLPAILRSALAETDADPSLVELEITEDSMSEDIEAFTACLGQIRKMNFEISIDDFGTGYSSLAYLRRFPVSRLKIDRSFVSEAITNPNSRAIIDAIIRMGHSLELKVIAEGAETLEQMHLLQALDCDEVQGYFVAGPMHEAALKTWLEEQRPSGSGHRDLISRLSEPAHAQAS